MLPPCPVPLESASNLRDLGGWPAADGRRVRRGLLFRGPALLSLSPQDHRSIEALGLRTVVDLRGARESAHNPVALPGARVPLPIEPSVGASLRDILRTGQMTGHVTAAEMHALLAQAYRDYALHCQAQYGAMLALLADETVLPLLLHCSAGKDRTGFGTALVLTALGVSWDNVVEDYLATNRLWKREIVRHFDLPPPVAEALLGADAALLEGAFAAARQTYGSIAAYFEQALGIGAPERARLAERLLEG